MPPPEPPQPLPPTLPADRNVCPVCGLELAARTPPELCPKCLLGAGMRSAAEQSDGLPAEGCRFGPYQLGRLLGAGGMGEVYEADELESGRRVALKVLSQRLDSPNARQRFLSEGLLAASINHPNSVYVFGTAEIAGVPVIAMELMPGGTLEQQVRAHGPLSINAAADAVVQLIDGLAAAHAVGILHRDIKPSNAFLDSDGTVKIGDYGLSISTEGNGGARTEDSFMGTPAFTSPEQLRGGELNVRSDIYAVGVTLFYLLTGRLPHESRDPVRQLVRVLETQAPSPASYRPELPPQLCQIVLRCLEKCPSDRFADYAELRRELVRFGTRGTQPAGLGQRLLAGAVDLMLVGVPLFAMLRLIPIQPGLLGALMELGKVGVAAFIYISYLALLDWRYGTTPGKALVGLHVAGQAGRLSGVEGLLRATARAAVLVLLPLLGTFMLLPPVRELTGDAVPTTVTLFGHSFDGVYHPISHESALGLSTLVVWIAATFLLFVGARRRNGWSALHDSLTATHVLATVEPETRSAQPQLDADSRSAGGPQLGPFHILESLADDWFVGYDRKLLRRVWLHKLPPNTAPTAAALRNLRRVGRLRWLAGIRSATENWDAYEFVSGNALLKLPPASVSWRALRHWMSDLATELQMSAADGTQPVAPCLQQIWITGEGRAKLLDCPAPGIDAPSTPATGNLLLELVERMLEKRPVALPVSRFLQTLPALKEPAAVCSELDRLAAVPVEVSRSRRCGILAASAAGPLALGLMFFLFKGVSAVVALGVVLAALIGLVAAPALLTAALAGEGLIMRALGVAVADHSGARASASLASRRSLIAWLPTLAAPALMAGLMTGVDAAPAGIATLALLAALATLSALLPERSLQDRLARTWLVPR